MGRGDVSPLRSLPRAFVVGLEQPLVSPFDLPKEEFDKFHKVLRLSSGAEVAILPGDGRLIRCVLEGRSCRPVETLCPETESGRSVTMCLALSKPESLEESVRMATELGARGFALFPSDRTVVRWNREKREARLSRLRKIAMEASEVSFRTRLPQFEWHESLGDVLKTYGQGLVLSEGEQVTRSLSDVDFSSGDHALVIGPEGGWAPREVAMIGDRAVTLGPRVLRVDTAVAAAATLALLGTSG